MRSTRPIRAGVLFCVALAGASAGAPAAAEEKITFDDLESGAIVDAVSTADGHTVRVLGINPRLEGNAAVIFDSSLPTPGEEGEGPLDADLGTPNEDFVVEHDDGTSAPGPGVGLGGREGSLCQNDRPLGKLLIVDTDLTPLTEDGRVAVPDDEGNPGARLYLDFSDFGWVTIHDMTFVDVEETPATVTFYDIPLEKEEARAHPKRRRARYRVRTLDNGVVRLFRPEFRTASEEGCYVRLIHRRRGERLTPVDKVKLIEVELSGSGAVDEIVFSPRRR